MDLFRESVHSPTAAKIASGHRPTVIAAATQTIEQVGTATRQRPPILRGPVYRKGHKTYEASYNR